MVNGSSLNVDWVRVYALPTGTVNADVPLPPWVTFAVAAGLLLVATRALGRSAAEGVRGARVG
jgi:hypothetical protein